MADLKSEKNVWLNKLRQTKDAVYTNPGAEKEHLNKYLESKFSNYDKQEQMNPSKYTEDDLEQAKCSIAEKILKHFDDTLFEMVCEEMSNNYLFQSSNYLTEAGYDIFEDEWFEFYHEHHGDILHLVKQGFTN